MDDTVPPTLPETVDVDEGHERKIEMAREQLALLLPRRDTRNGTDMAAVGNPAGAAVNNATMLEGEAGCSGLLRRPTGARAKKRKHQKMSISCPTLYPNAAMKEPARSPTFQRATKYPPTQHDRKQDTPSGTAVNTTTNVSQPETCDKRTQPKKATAAAQPRAHRSEHH